MREGAVGPFTQVDRIGVDEHRKIDLIFAVHQELVSEQTNAYLHTPPRYNHRCCRPLLLIPNRQRLHRALFICHIMASAAFHHLLLRRRVRDTPTIMGRVDPPDNCKEYSPCGGEDVVGEEDVRKVERATGVFLLKKDKRMSEL